MGAGGDCQSTVLDKKEKCRIKCEHPACMVIAFLGKARRVEKRKCFSHGVETMRKHGHVFAVVNE